jgi:hypothetical protein
MIEIYWFNLICTQWHKILWYFHKHVGKKVGTPCIDTLIEGIVSFFRLDNQNAGQSVLLFIVLDHVIESHIST